MICRAQAIRDPEPRRHWPIFSPPDLPAGYAECLVCRYWITAVDLLDEVCRGETPEDYRVVGAPLDAKHSDQLNAWRSVDVRPVQAEGSCSESREPGHLDPVTASPGRSESATGHLFLDARAIERERTLGMIRRCAERQW